MLPGDYTEYKMFLEEVTSDNTEDLTCLRVLPYKVSPQELQPEIINQLTNYLQDKRCPAKLYYKIIKNTSQNLLNELKKSPYSCGFDDNNEHYDGTKLHILTLNHLKTYCNRLLDNIELNNILPAALLKNMDEIDGNAPTEDLPKHIVCATKNRRRYMEDRHTCMEQLNHIYNIETNRRASFYAVYDGHAGHAAATYSAAHFPYNLVTNENYPTHPEMAMREAFRKTDSNFISKQIDSGSTTVCALYLPDELSLYVGWVGDSRAMLAREGSIYQIVKAHRPDVESERERIESSGGTIMMWGGELRVNGMINITRAIGDRSCKPFLISEPDLVKLNLNNKEDFLVLGCDGLWDHVKDAVIAETIYELLEQDCDNLDRIPKQLIDLAKKGFSSDNITIIIVFFKHPSKIQRPTEIMESPTFDSFDVAAVKIEASEECSNNANTDFNNLCWLKKENNQDQVDDVLLATEQKYQFNDDLNNILDPSMIKVEEHLNLNNQNNLPCIKSLNGADDKVMNDHDFMNDDGLQTENNHFAEEKNNLVSFDDFGPETSVDEFVPEKKLNDSEEIENEESVVPMETTVSSSPSIEVTPNIFEELNFQEQAEEVIITPSSDLDDDSGDKQLSSVDNTNTLSEVDEEPEKMVFEHDAEDILKSPVEDILKSPVKEAEPEPTIDQNMLVEENNHELVVESMEPETVTDIDDNKNTFNDEHQEEREEEEEEDHFESTMNDSKANIVAESVEQQPPVQDSCEESDEEWNYMKAKEGHTEKENNVLSEEFKENIEPEPVTEKEISSVELKEQVDVCGAAVDLDIAAPKTPEPVLFVVDDLQTTPEMTEENNFHLNPDAKVFVPTAYTPPAPTVTETHTEQNGELDTLQVKQPYRHVFDDVVAQSPRKGRESNMDDFQLPAENDFDVEIANRPHELLDDDVKMPEAEAGEPAVIEEPAVELQTENELLIQNALDNVGMKDSLYVENTSSGFNNGEVDLLNTIQQLPTDVDPEDNNVLSNKEGLSLEIDEKDVISPSSDDIKEIVTEIEEKVQDMHIQEAEVPLVESNSLPLESDANVSNLLDESQPIVDISMEDSKPVHDFNPFAEEIKEEFREPVVEEIKEPVVEQAPEPVVEEVKAPDFENVPEPMFEQISEPVVEFVPEPVLEPVVEPAQEQLVEAVPEQAVEALPEQVMEHVPEPVIESVVEKEPIAEEPKILETPTTNGDINVEELNKKNLEESAKLDAPVKIEDSKLLEATLGVVAVTAAATASVKAASSVKKSPATKSTTLSAAKKPATITTAAKKPGLLSTSSAAARPKTAPVKSTTERKPATTTSRTSTLTSAAKPRVEVKKTTTTSTLSKPKEVTKTTEIRRTTTTSSARSTVPKTASATAPRPRPASASFLTNGISKTNTSKTTTTTSSTLKPTSTTASATPKPRLSPRSTVSSSLRKAETLKSPSTTAKKEPTTSRIDSGLKSATKPAAGPPKPLTLRATKPAVGTTSSTTSSRLTVKATPTTTSQRKTASPLDKKKSLAPTTTSTARKSLSMTRTPSKSPGAKPTAVKPAAPAVEPVAPVEPTVVEPAAVPHEVVAAPPAVDIPIA